MRPRINYDIILLLGLVGILGIRQDNWCEGKETERLRERVTQFYSAIQAKQWEKAEEFVTEKSRLTFRNEPRGKMQSFTILHIAVEEPGKSAVVETALKVPTSPFFHLDVSRLTRWKFESGDWFWDADDPPPTMSDKFAEMYKKQEARIKKSPNATPLEVKFEKDLIDFGVVAKGKTLTLTFPFTNLSSQTIKIERVYVQPEFTKDATKKFVIKPGEKAEVIIELDTSQLYSNVDQTVVVELQPIQELIQLRIKGKVFEAKYLEKTKPH